MRWTLAVLLLSFLGCNAGKKIEEVHFGPSPGDTEEEIIEELSHNTEQKESQV